MRVTIAIPTLNRFEEAVAQASRLEKDLSSLCRIVLSDNASDTVSESDVRRAQQALPGVTVVQQPVQLSQWQHFATLALDHADTEYFTWVADDDFWDPEFFRNAVRLLDGDPGLDVVWPRAFRADPDGTPRGNQLNVDLRDLDRVDRLLAWQRLPSWAGIFALFRTAFLQQGLRTFRFSGIPGDDVLFISHLLTQTAPALAPQPEVGIRWVKWKSDVRYVAPEIREWYSSAGHRRLLEALLRQTLAEGLSLRERSEYLLRMFTEVALRRSAWNRRLRVWTAARATTPLEGASIESGWMVYRLFELPVRATTAPRRLAGATLRRLRVRA